MNTWVVVTLFLFLIIILLVGLYMSKFTKKPADFLQEYFLGSRQLGGFILAMSMVATYGSASSFLSGPGTAYNVGLGWVLLASIQVVTGYFTLMVLGKKFAIVARKMKAVTMIDFLKTRYHNKWVAIFAAVSIVIFLFASMAAQWVGGGRLIQSITGLPYISALFIFTLAALIFVVVGGFRALAMTDMIQGTIMFAGTLILLIGTIIAGGGIPHIIHQMRAADPGLITPYGPHHQLSSAYVSSFWILVGVGVIGLPQITIRAMSYKNSKSLHRAIIIGTIVVGVIMLGMHLTGAFARAVIPGVKVGDEVMPLLAMKVLPPWLAGIVLAAPMAAIISTVDALLLLVSSSIIKDIILNYIKPNMQQPTVRRWSHWVTAIIGVIVFIMAIHPPNLLIWLNLFAFGGLESAFIWPILFGLYWRKGNAYGALASMITGVVLYVVIQSFMEWGWISEPLGVNPVVLPVVFSFIVFVSVSIMTDRKIDKEQLLRQNRWLS
ncbi:sodium/pantothenate symporter [Pullulanibacillus pueri]|uniref:Sodium/panthothenate symporter n=1 Tax=Pullulanibacillus pueri TaxID=1437324 RepID=A0A8J3EM61_9BACL|nr:sodium/pantothenate symporter [Pullulanibacillus pueri]MBM7680666.1 sodium/pantothenate symporter [Pullulanibacillus pueri]GGH83797.1 sodium/panthothenate symporter [Pullulanibacillus pueri]